MAQVEILAENEGRGGWDFAVQVLDDAGKLRRHRLTLSWADYNLWTSDGGDAPSNVAEAVIGFLLSRAEAQTIPERFDASIARRLYADADQTIPSLIGR